MNRTRWAFLLLLASKTALAETEINVFFESEFGYGFEQDEIRKAESNLHFEIEGSLGEEVQYTFIPKVRFDFEDTLSRGDNRKSNYSSINGPISHSHEAVLEIAEAYVEFEAFDANWTLGKQQVVWGEADGIKVLDLVNPQDLREFNLDSFEESRIPTWMVNAEFELTAFEESTLQFLLIPDMTFNRLADSGTDFDVSTPFLRPRLDSGLLVSAKGLERPSGELEAGVRWSIYLDGWDFSFIYLNHYHDLPVIYRTPDGAGRVEVSPVYQRNNVYGMSASNAFDDWVMRLEVGYNSSNYHTSRDLSAQGVRNSSAINSVLGLDYHGFSDMLVSYQWFQTTLADYTDDILRDQFNMMHTIIVRQDFWNDTLTLKWFGLFDHQSDDGELRAEVMYRYSDSLSMWAGVDLFYGRQEGLFGQFNDNDRLILGFKYGL